MCIIAVLRPVPLKRLRNEKADVGPDCRAGVGQRVKADRYTSKVLKLVGDGKSYREISHRLGLSKNTVLDIVKRDRAAKMPLNT